MNFADFQLACGVETLSIPLIRHIDAHDKRRDMQNTSFCVHLGEQEWSCITGKSPFLWHAQDLLSAHASLYPPSAGITQPSWHARTTLV